MHPPTPAGLADGHGSRRLYKDGQIRLTALPSGRRRLQVEREGRVQSFPLGECETSYPDDLIDLVAAVHGVAWLADAIARDEAPEYVATELSANLFSFWPRERFAGTRLLDFGCGSGASSVILGRLLPATEIVGVELEGRLLELAAARAKHHGLHNVTFHVSPDPSSLPAGIGPFDFCMMSAVVEHMLPDERRSLLPTIWRTLRPGGVLFLNQTPHRWFPVESHSTGLPLLNYLPDALAFRAARRFSRQADMSGWSAEALLRGGLRGATEHELLRYLAAARDGSPVVLNPVSPAHRDRVDLWYARLSPRYRPAKAVAARLLKLVERVTGEVVVQNLTLAIQKQMAGDTYRAG